MLDGVAIKRQFVDGNTVHLNRQTGTVASVGTTDIRSLGISDRCEDSSKVASSQNELRALTLREVKISCCTVLIARKVLVLWSIQHPATEERRYSPRPQKIIHMNKEKGCVSQAKNHSSDGVKNIVCEYMQRKSGWAASASFAVSLI